MLGPPLNKAGLPINEGIIIDSQQESDVEIISITESAGIDSTIIKTNINDFEPRSDKRAPSSPLESFLKKKK